MKALMEVKCRIVPYILGTKIRPVGRFCLGGQGVLFKERWTIDLYITKHECMEFARRVLV